MSAVIRDLRQAIGGGEQGVVTQRLSLKGIISVEENE